MTSCFYMFMQLQGSIHRYRTLDQLSLFMNKFYPIEIVSKTFYLDYLMDPVT